MKQFSPVEIANWVAIYLAAGLCCMVAMVLSVTVTVHGLWKDKTWNDVRTLRGAVLFLPKEWWGRDIKRAQIYSKSLVQDWWP